MKQLLMASLMAFSMISFAADVKSNAKQPKTLIVGGEDAAKGEFPFIASLHTRYYGHTCGGSLIAKNWVLTAGHCAGEDLTITKIYVGLHKQAEKGEAETFEVKRIVRHPQYNEESADGGPDYDFALIELNRDSTVTPIALNSEEKSIPKKGDDSIIVTTAGWGATRENSYSTPDILQKVQVPLVHQDICNQSYDNGVTDRMICAGYTAGGKDSCQGDSGGPLFETNDDNTFSLVGVVSWGEGCARPNKFGVYSKVNSVVSWITETIKQ